MEGETLRLQQPAPGSRASIGAGASTSALYGNGLLLSLHPNGFLVIFHWGFCSKHNRKKKKIFKTQNVQECTRQNIANRERTLSVKYEIIKSCVTVSHRYGKMEDEGMQPIFEKNLSFKINI